MDTEEPDEGSYRPWAKRSDDPDSYRLWVSDKILVRMWGNGTVEVATRPTPGATWGPPTSLREEIVPNNPRPPREYVRPVRDDNHYDRPIR